MTDIEKAIRALTFCSDKDVFYPCPLCPYYEDDDCQDLLQKDCLKLLSTNVPKKVEDIVYPASRNNLRAMFGHCPSCYNIINEVSEKKACGRCGQKVVWE